MSLALFDRALVAVRDFLAVTQSDRVLIVEDGTLGPRLTAAFATASRVQGAETVVVTYQPRNFISMKEYGLFAEAARYADRNLIPSALREAMLSSDVIVVLNSDIQFVFDVRFAEINSGTRRIALIPYLDEDSFLRLMTGGVAEADSVQAFTEKIGDVIKRTREAVIESTAGTNLRMEIGNHRINVHGWYGTNGRGTPGMAYWPGGQVSTVPNAHTAEGVFVIDRSVNVPEFRQLRDPITFRVEKGYVVAVEGGHEATLMRRFLESRDDGGEAYHVTELGLGTNPRCKQTGIAGPAEDTHTLGCVSLALGTDVHLGGDTLAGCHIDMTMASACLTVDGTPLVKDGAFLPDVS